MCFSSSGDYTAPKGKDEFEEITVSVHIYSLFLPRYFPTYTSIVFYVHYQKNKIFLLFMRVKKFPQTISKSNWRLLKLKQKKPPTIKKKKCRIFCQPRPLNESEIQRTACSLFIGTIKFYSYHTGKYFYLVLIKYGGVTLKPFVVDFNSFVCIYLFFWLRRICSWRKNQCCNPIAAIQLPFAIQA